MAPELVVIFIFVGIPWMLAWVFKLNLSHQRYMKALQLKAEMNSRLLDRAGSDPAILEYLKSDAQQHLFDVKVPDAVHPASVPYMRALTAAQASFFLLSAGAACAWLTVHAEPGRDWVPVFKLFGALGIALGIGAMLAAVSAFVAARMWHTLNQNS